MLTKIMKLLKPSSVFFKSEGTIARTSGPARSIKSLTTENKNDVDKIIKITVDVRGYKDVKVKTYDDFVHIEGQSEERTANGFVSRQFVKRIRLPKGCSAKDVTPTFSDDGILTVTMKEDCSNKSSQN